MVRLGSAELLFYFSATQMDSSCIVHSHFSSPGKVQVDFFVMARCPDAQFCEQNFAEGIQAVASIIDLNLNYIANVSSTGAFTCRHGPDECTGDMQQLCVRESLDGAAAPTGEPLFFDFALCQSQTRYNIPANGEACNQQAQTGLDWNVVETCVNGTLGAKLLDASIARMVPGTNDSISCTINLNTEFWCQHNDDWFGCTEGTTTQAFVAAVCERYTGSSPPTACQQYYARKAAAAPKFALFQAKDDAREEDAEQEERRVE
jgi:hypothetical protein